MAQKSAKPPLSAVQLEIMELVWERGEVTVQDVWRALSAKRTVARNTVLTLMTRLEAKGWLRHRAAGNAFLYTAARKRGSVLPQFVSHVVDTVFQGSVFGLVSALLEARPVSKEEAEEIRDLIDKARSRK